MPRLFDSPATIIIIIVIALLLFGAPKLPGMARSIGQSLRIFKSEVKQMKDDPKPDADSEENNPVEGRVVQPGTEKPSRSTAHSRSEDAGTQDPPSNRSS